MPLKYILLLLTSCLLLAFGIILLNCDDEHIRFGAVGIMSAILIFDVIDSISKIVKNGLEISVIYVKYFLAIIFVGPALAIVFLNNDWHVHLILTGIIIGISDIYNTLFFISWSNELDFEYRHATIRWTIFIMPPKFLIAGLLFFIAHGYEYVHKSSEETFVKFNHADVMLSGKIAIGCAILYFLLFIASIIIDILRGKKIIRNKDDDIDDDVMRKSYRRKLEKEHYDSLNSIDDYINRNSDDE